MEAGSSKKQYKGGLQKMTRFFRAITVGSSRCVLQV